MKASENVSTHVPDIEGRLPEHFPNNDIIPECYPNPLASTIIITIMSKNAEKSYGGTEGKNEEGRRERKKSREREK